MKCLLLWVVITLIEILKATNIPVECFTCNITGIWEFRITVPEKKSSPTLNECGHDIPDRAVTAPDTEEKYKSEMRNAVKFEMSLYDDGTLQADSIFREVNGQNFIEFFGGIYRKEDLRL